MEDPEDFLCVFEHLVRHDQVGFTIGEWKRFALNIGDFNVIGFPG